MSVQAGGRLAVLAVFLAYQSLYFALEFSLFVPKALSSKPADPRRVLFQYLQPVLLGFLGAIIVPIIFQFDQNDIIAQNSQNSSCRAFLDPDIGGDGMRVAIWVQGFVLLLIAFIGTFHDAMTGAKEVGAGLAITHFSFALALLAQLLQADPERRPRRRLTPASAIIGAMVLDSQNSALSIQLITKETLASRWQVGVIVVCQTLGIVIEPILVQSFRSGSGPNGLLAPDKKDCNCLSVFWWGWITNCPNRPSYVPHSEMHIFWAYYALRCVFFVHSSLHALLSTQRFHRAEKHGTRLKKITYPQFRQDNPNSYSPWGEKLRLWLTGRSYRTYVAQPTTVSLMYIVYGMFMITSMAAVEITMEKGKAIFQLEENHAFTFGQLVAVIVALLTVGRALWLFLIMFLKDGTLKNLRKSSFKWPLQNFFPEK
ncbi:hypothetical protein EsH8_IX_000108 [Colletotrichum jinshuiense]